jgi:hypothetical protein
MDCIAIICCVVWGGSSPSIPPQSTQQIRAMSSLCTKPHTAHSTHILQSNCILTLKRDYVTRFSISSFFHESFSPKPLSILLRPFQILLKICGDICSSRYTTTCSKKYRDTVPLKFVICTQGGYIHWPVSVGLKKKLINVLNIPVIDVPIALSVPIGNLHVCTVLNI